MAVDRKTFFPQHHLHLYRSSYQPASNKPKVPQIATAQQQQQQQSFLAQTGFGGPADSLPAGAGTGARVGVGLMTIPSYADQMHSAFLDYQHQRVEFEQQQNQLLQKLYQQYPDVSGAQIRAQGQKEQQQQPPQQKQHPSECLQAANGFVYQRQQFGINGLQPGGPPKPTGGSMPLRFMRGAGDFYSTQQHMGFMQQQQQEVLHDQQQLVAQQFATSQLAPTTRQSYGMAVPMSSVLSAPSFPEPLDINQVNFTGGNLGLL
ncbi:headcase protein-like isoform X2 [Drosophila kikkawai]|uniref:Headcase protein-like isoform X2 n=1 Tax=Drosophila kikkawai TaxID=30033 RepID=A0ABM4GGG2_DROKI